MLALEGDIGVVGDIGPRREEWLDSVGVSSPGSSVYVSLLERPPVVLLLLVSDKVDDPGLVSVELRFSLLDDTLCRVVCGELELPSPLSFFLASG